MASRRRTYVPKNDPTAKSVYEFIKTYRREHGGISPSTREIGEACYLGASGVLRMLDALEAWGKIFREKGIARGIRVLDEEK